MICAIEALRPVTRAMCNELIDAVIDKGTCDASGDYAKHVPTRVIARMIGIGERDHEKFRVWGRRLAEEGITDFEVFTRTIAEVDTFFAAEIEDRRRAPRDDLIRYLLAQSIEGQPLTLEHLQGTLRLLLFAGIDTTWSAIGLCLLHLARTPAHRRALIENPGLMPTAIEEWLRRIPQFEVADEAAITWAPGVVRGPRQLPIRFENGLAAHGRAAQPPSAPI